MEVCRCQVCTWQGYRDQLLGVASEGLTLEDRVSKLTQDLLQFFSVKMGDELGFFLARWGIVDPDEEEQMRMVTARVVGRMASGVLQYCLGGDEEPVAPEMIELDDLIERVGVGLAERLIQLKVVEPGSPELVESVAVVMKELGDCVVARCSVADEEDADGGEGPDEG